MCFSVLSLPDPHVFTPLLCCFANNLHFISGLEPLCVSAIRKCNDGQINWVRTHFANAFWFEFGSSLRVVSIAMCSIWAFLMEVAENASHIHHPTIANDKRVVVMSQCSFCFLCTAGLRAEIALWHHNTPVSSRLPKSLDWVDASESSLLSCNNFRLCLFFLSCYFIIGSIPHLIRKHWT